jgi:hypothetical protein
MNIKALITTLVLGSSSVAVAEPVVSASAHASWSWGTPNITVAPDARVTVIREQREWSPRDHRFDREYRYERDRNYYPYRPIRPIYDERFDDPRNTQVGPNSSVYQGPIFQIPQGRYYIRPNWTAITEPTRIDGGREFINIQNAGPVDRLMLRAVAGSTFIEQVAVSFANGDTQVFRGLNATLDGRNPTLQLNVKGRHREVTRVVVYGSSAPRSAYQLMGM